MRTSPLFFLLALSAGTSLAAQGREGDIVVPTFRFANGQVLDNVKLHYTVLGQPRRDAGGTTRNAVLVLHGTGGTGSGFLGAGFAGELFGPGKLLDTTQYFVILPDNIGHGKSSKPSDGLRMKFPAYGYTDMVHLQHALLQGLGVNHLRLVMGTSMGCMHAWVWGYTYPTFADGLVPLACAPTQIAGRNRMMRTMIRDFITQDPDWKGGDYTSPPRGLKAASGILYMMTSAPLVQHRQAPTRDRADSTIRTYIEGRFRAQDPNDMLYQFDASSDYDPSPHLEKVTAPVLAINSADDLVNPPELGLMERLMPRVARGKYILIPTSERTRGHGTHSQPAIWGTYLAEFVKGLK
ncbi:MAG: alpha/beta fold hydrolase [Gemmatimonadetes bacterium]|nr:alpha/beta fold hydrolase [Gemmatimonadota bacterium]